MTRLYLDDVRNPPPGVWHVVRSYREFVGFIIENGVPDHVSFDHDLGDETTIIDHQPRELTGYDCAVWLGHYCYENGLPLPTWTIHSSNPVGRDNIESQMRFATRRIELSQT
jgi:hypothetical protein